MKKDSIIPALIFGGGGGVKPSGTLSIASNGTYDVTEYAAVDVNVSGSGGDLATCTVTGVADSYNDYIDFYAPLAVDDEDNKGHAYGGTIDMSKDDTYKLILYKGSGLLIITDGQISGVSGDAEIVESGVIKYTGNFSITISHN